MDMGIWANFDLQSHNFNNFLFPLFPLFLIFFSSFFSFLFVFHLPLPAENEGVRRGRAMPVIVGGWHFLCTSMALLQHLNRTLMSLKWQTKIVSVLLSAWVTKRTKHLHHYQDFYTLPFYYQGHAISRTVFLS